MAKKSNGETGKSLVIVESPAKARTISKFLGSDFIVEASIGHVRDLPEGAKQIPAEYKGEEWAYLGVNVNEDFDPIYIVPPGKTAQVRKLKRPAQRCQRPVPGDGRRPRRRSHQLALARVAQAQGSRPSAGVSRNHQRSDPRSACAPARHRRTTWSEPQETRRILDRLYGYEVSPLLWRKVRPKLSAGRVQSVAVRLIVERERERMAFRLGHLLGLARARSPQQQAQQFQADAGLGRRPQAFPPARTSIRPPASSKNADLLLLDERGGRASLADKLRPADFRVASLEDKPYTSKPYPPFTTSTLQQEANRKLGFTARRTMQVAQSLYENGHITYMRTDSTNLAKVAVEAARDLVSSQYGADICPTKPRIYSDQSQERPRSARSDSPGRSSVRVARGTARRTERRRIPALRLDLEADRRQPDDRRPRAADHARRSKAAARVFQVGGKTIDFPGYLRAYVEGSDDPAAELADKKRCCQPWQVGETLDCRELEPKSHTTQPPARFTEATLTRALEELGSAGPAPMRRSSTRFSPASTCSRRGTALVPTWTAFSVVAVAGRHLPDLVDYRFTAQMEDDLDAISRGEAEHLDYLQRFYYGNGKRG